MPKFTNKLFWVKVSDNKMVSQGNLKYEIKYFSMSNRFLAKAGLEESYWETQGQAIEWCNSYENK